ncbi:MAG: hypothetical protein WCG50_13330 [Rhodoferax sp.]|uniref:hypothetical protein n=1 Tax=Rhodoferax sp. TaxID=50421 RepID=UPI00301AEA3E
MAAVTSAGHAGVYHGAQWDRVLELGARPGQRARLGARQHQTRQAAHVAGLAFGHVDRAARGDVGRRNFHNLRVQEQASLIGSVAAIAAVLDAAVAELPAREGLHAAARTRRWHLS